MNLPTDNESNEVVLPEEVVGAGSKRLVFKVDLILWRSSLSSWILLFFEITITFWNKNMLAIHLRSKLLFE